MAWTNGPLTLFHGTDSVSLGLDAPLTAGSPVPNFVIDLAACRSKTDFGRGFYTTSWEHQAREWANNRARRNSASGRRANSGVILRFQVSRDWLACQEALVFTRSDADYWDFIACCRSGCSTHNRSGPRPEYGIVYGPVSLWPQRLVITGSDQISFHGLAVQGLPTPAIHLVATGPRGQFI